MKAKKRTEKSLPEKNLNKDHNFWKKHFFFLFLTRVSLDYLWRIYVLAWRNEVATVDLWKQPLDVLCHVWHSPTYSSNLKRSLSHRYTPSIFGLPLTLSPFNHSPLYSLFGPFQRCLWLRNHMPQDLPVIRHYIASLTEVFFLYNTSGIHGKAAFSFHAPQIWNKLPK